MLGNWQKGPQTLCPKLGRGERPQDAHGWSVSFSFQAGSAPPGPPHHAFPYSSQQGPGVPLIHPLIPIPLFLKLPLWSRRWNLAPGDRCLSSSSRNQHPSHSQY